MGPSNLRLLKPPGDSRQPFGGVCRRVNQEQLEDPASGTRGRREDARRQTSLLYSLKSLAFPPHVWT